jgi:hypothetical protein
MSENIAKIFKYIGKIEPSENLEGRILRSIAAERLQAVRRKLAYARVGMAFSAAGLMYAFSVFGRAFLKSDFWNLTKLAFSDGSTVTSHFGNFALSLLETLPVVEISAMLVPVFALLMIASWNFKFSNNSLRHNHSI